MRQRLMLLGAQFNVEQDRARQAQDLANKYGLDVLAAQTRAGDIQRRSRKRRYCC